MCKSSDQSLRCEQLLYMCCRTAGYALQNRKTQDDCLCSSQLSFASRQIVFSMPFATHQQASYQACNGKGLSLFSCLCYFLGLLGLLGYFFRKAFCLMLCKPLICLSEDR